jgi:hypothetical protein
MTSNAMTVEQIKILPGGVFYHGKDAPRLVRVHLVDEDYVYYEFLPIRSFMPVLAMEAKRRFTDSVRGGTKTRLDRMEGFLRTERARNCKEATREEYQHRIEVLKNVLAGAAVSLSSRLECADLEGTVTVSGYDSDPWELIDLITGGCCNTSYVAQDETLYECTVFGIDGYRQLKAHPAVQVRSVRWSDVDVLGTMDHELRDLQNGPSQV